MLKIINADRKDGIEITIKDDKTSLHFFNLFIHQDDFSNLAKSLPDILIKIINHLNKFYQLK